MQGGIEPTGEELKRELALGAYKRSPLVAIGFRGKMADLEKIRLLMAGEGEDGIRWPLNEPDGTKSTCVAQACIGYAEFDFVKALIENLKADINIPTLYGYTTLHMAANAGQLNIVKLLCAQPSHPGINQLSEEGLTPLHMVCYKGSSVPKIQDRINVAKWLIDNGADRSIKNRLGYTAAEMAVFQGFRELADFLNSYTPDTVIQIEQIAPTFVPGADAYESRSFSANASGTNQSTMQQSQDPLEYCGSKFQGKP